MNENGFSLIENMVNYNYGAEGWGDRLHGVLCKPQCPGRSIHAIKRNVKFTMINYSLCQSQ